MLKLLHTVLVCIFLIYWMCAGMGIACLISVLEFFWKSGRLETKVKVKHRQGERPTNRPFNLWKGQCHEIFDPLFFGSKDSPWATYEQAKTVSQIFSKIFDNKVLNSRVRIVNDYFGMCPRTHNFLTVCKYLLGTFIIIFLVFFQN